VSGGLSAQIADFARRDELAQMCATSYSNSAKLFLTALTLRLAVCDFA
jgi:hypothetical protein